MYLTGNQVRQSFLNFFAERGHTIVPSASLVPGGDSTLLFTNAGMVQFKDVFLGTDTRPYTRAADSQKCMRVSGKHNDLDTVGRDNTHHTFFEMLGNWSFGDYYKDEAIGWSWELLTRVWGLEPGRLYATIFEDDQGSLPRDDEAAQAWLRQPGFDPSHLITGGRKDNLWEMAETGPCGPSTEIHYDFGPQACDRQGEPGHVCQVNGDCSRIVEIWNNVFIQYNRVSADEFLPLPRRHVDTGMGFERIVSIIQGVRGNYETDLLKPLLDETQRIAGQTDQQRQANLTPYRVIADHVRAAAFLIADGVIPGNLGRNYVCRMIIRRAARFARKLDLTEPFMASVARKVIEGYQEAYPELAQNSELIQETLTREEIRFGETLDAGFTELRGQIAALRARAETRLDGRTAFNLYATLGFPLEITRDILAEENLGVDEAGFYEAMEEHRIASGKGQAFGEGAEVSGESYRQTLQDLIQAGSLPEGGVSYDPTVEALLPSGPIPALTSIPDGWTARRHVAGLWGVGAEPVTLSGADGATAEAVLTPEAATRLGVQDGRQLSVGGQVLLVRVESGDGAVVRVPLDLAIAEIGDQGWITLERNGSATSGTATDAAEQLSAASGVPLTFDPSKQPDPSSPGLIYVMEGGKGQAAVFSFRQKFSALLVGQVSSSILGVISRVGLVLGFIIAASSFIASVQERRREFGIMASVGLSDEVLYFFLIESLMLFVIAFVGGILLGAALLVGIVPRLFSLGAWLEASALAAVYLPVMAIVAALIPVHRLLQERPVNLLAEAA